MTFFHLRQFDLKVRFCHVEASGSGDADDGPTVAEHLLRVLSRHRRFEGGDDQKQARHRRAGQIRPGDALGVRRQRHRQHVRRGPAQGRYSVLS